MRSVEVATFIFLAEKAKRDVQKTRGLSDVCIRDRRYLTRKKWILNIYRILVGGMVLFGALAALDVAWSLADVTMGLMALCNLIAISLLGKYAFKLLEDYRAQKRAGIKYPVFTKDRLKEVENDIECW